MANDEDLARLRQGVTVWNGWRAQNRERRVDLSRTDRDLVAVSPIAANLNHTDLRGADLSGTNLAGADLEGADLRGADLGEANLRGADLRFADLRANLGEANLWMANLNGANLNGANLSGSDLRFARLRGTDLGDTNLWMANLSGATLEEANLSGATLVETVFVDVDLRATKGLETCAHSGPSFIDYPTLQQSGRLPLAFLRGCGLPDRLIDYLPSLIEEAIQYYSCFISYSSKDDVFAKRLHADLQNSGVRCWFAPHDLPIGAKTWDAIDEAIKVRDKVLLILSRSAIDSDWVENEVSKAFAEERRRKQVVLFPVQCDRAALRSAS